MSKGRPSRRRRFSREPRLEALEARQLLASDISNEAMEFIYELNLARHDPQAYAVAAGLPAAMLAGVEAQPPLALNDELENSALFHATEMAAYDYFDHQSAITGDWPNQMAVDAGYPLPSNYPLTSNYIESIAAGTFLSNPNEVLRLLIEDEGLSTPGHRYHLLATGPSQSFWETHREIGVGHAYSPVATYRNYWAVHTAPRTEQLTFLTGVVFDDANSNGSFDAGEGLGDVTIDVNGTTVVTNSAGGWKLAVSAGDYVITASGGNLAGAASTTATVGADNVEVDFVSGNVNGFVNFAEVAIPPSVDPPPADWVRTSRELGAVNAGVAARDGATGEGYLMHSRQPVHERFGDLPAGNSDHLVVVVYQDGQWSYDNDNALVPFVPVSTDVLLAQVDFDADTVTSLENLETETNGIATGYVGGDLQFAADIWSGAADDGEFTVTGAAFAALGPADRYELGATNLGIAADESATGVGYILFSQLPVAERFTNVTIANGNSDHLVVVQFVDGQWILDANGSRRVFSPRSDDLLLAEVDYDADTVTALQGQSLWRDGIRAGYVDGDLAFAANVWAGAPNDGEFGVSGAWFTAAEPEKLTWQADPGAGVRVRDDATGTGFLMLSETSLRSRFPASDWPADSSDQFVAVVFTAGQWYFDNDTELTPFLPESSDLLVAALDFDNDAATLLDQFGWRHGIRSGFTGSLTVTPEQFNGSADSGEFEVTVSALQRLDEQPRVTMPTGPLGQGLAANDGATGSGYIMYSPQSIHERFSGIPTAVSDHFIVVIHQQGVWKYDNNGQIREFTPLAGDTLVASIDFDASQVTALAGVRGLVHGMPSGYLDGDLVFYADQYAGAPNDGEFQVGGTYLTTNVASARYQIGALGQGIAANDLASGDAYLLYSAESLFDRFSNAPIPALNSEHLIIAFYANNQWHFDANGATRTFTPRETDVILADVNYTSDTITSLQGMLSDRHGIQAGFVDGDLVFHANRWNGADNEGEFQVDGSWFSTLPLAVTTVQSDFAGQVHTHDTSGAGHLMFSREPLSERFTFDRVPDGANEHLVAVRYADGQWQYDDGEAWIAFVPLASDMIVADLDFAAGEVELLERVFGRVHGVDTGYLAGDLTVTPNAEGFLVAGAVVRRRALEANTSFSVGLLAGGIAARDEATDRGFLMFTQQEIADRFGNVPSGVSAQLILVVYQNGRWHYDNNGSLFPFTPRGSDVLLAEVDYLNDTITSLEGRTGSHHGIQLGYLNGNLQFFANQFGGVANYGEFQVTGSYFSTAMELDRFQLGPIGAGIAANDNATGPAHILYSVENLFDRFANQPPISQNSAHMIVVFHNNDQWYYDANGVVRPFTPRATDTILADVDYDTGSVTSLEGQVVERHGISAGFSKGDLTFLGNYWGGSANDGEFKVTGTYFDVVARDKHEQSVGSLNDGVAARVNATGDGYLMYSGQAVSTRFAVAAPPAGASDHVVIVVYENGQWLYDNGSALTPFTPDGNDVLLAEIDFDANTVTPLRDEFGEYQGIRFGYSGGDLRYVSEQYAGAAAAGQFQVTGQLFLVHSDPVVSPLGTLRGGIAARDNAQESGYLMYSAQVLGQRFGDMPGNTSDHLAPVVFQNGAWHYDNGSQLVQFTPAAGDVLLAEVDFASDTLVSLAGRLGSHEGIASGFLDGDLAFFVNQFGGVPNAGEFQVTGTYFTR